MKLKKYEYLEIPFRVIALICHYISYLFPRKEKRWLFGDGTGFNSNGKHYFLQILNTYPEVEAYWIGDRQSVRIARNLNLPAYNRFSLKGLYLCLTAKYYIVSHTQGCINFWTSGGAKVINLWHGIGWKACLWSNPTHQIYKQKNRIENFIHLLFFPHLYFKPDLLLSTSQYMTHNFFMPMFDVDESKCVEDIYPRCRYMLQPKEKLIEDIKKYGREEELNVIDIISKFDKVILYAPTFRDAQYDFIKESKIDFDKLNQNLKLLNFIFLVKFHPSTNLKNLRISNYSNILFVDKCIDSYNIMPFTDLLISDYSSIVFDYMLLNKSVILYPFDKSKYLSSSRKMVFNYEDLVEGLPIVNNFEELLTLINKDINNSINIDKFWSPTTNLTDSIFKL